MSAAEPAVLPPSPGGPPSFRRAAARGLMWMAGQTVAVKVTALGGNVVLAYLISRHDFGLIGLSLTAMAFPMIACQTGVQQILVRRQRHFRRWQHAAVGLSLCLGAAGLAAAAVAAPAAAWVYGRPELTPLLLVQGLALPAYCLAAVPGARLQIDLRFRLLAMVNVAATVLSTGVSVTLAVLHFGAYSVVLGQLASAVLVLAVTWRAARLALPRRLHARRWKYLVGDGWWMTGTSITYIAVAQGDRIILGLTQPPEVVGVYYWAYTQSTQAVQLVTVNLAGVLLPMLSKTGAAAQQVMRYLSAAEVMAYVGVPLCLLQAMLARPAVSLVYPDGKWDASVVPLQVLSLAMIPVVVGGHTMTLMQAQGRFRANFYYGLACAAVFLTSVGVAARFGAAAAVAVGVSVSYGLQATLGLLWAVGVTRQTLAKLGGLAFGSVLVGGSCAAAAWPLATLAARHLHSPHWAFALVVTPLFVGLYAVALRVFRRRVWSIILNPSAAG